MADAALRDADRWWHELPPTRRLQLHRMFDRDAREQPLPEHQLALDVQAGTVAQ